MWIAKHLPQASCTELTLPSLIGVDPESYLDFWLWTPRNNFLLFCVFFRYFFVTKSYWCGPGVGSGLLTHDSDIELPEINGSRNIEKEPNNLPLGVSVQHLHKVYPNGKVAIEDLNLNFYEGQITSFLGHNGAGKTTTM